MTEVLTGLTRARFSSVELTLLKIGQFAVRNGGCYFSRIVERGKFPSMRVRISLKIGPILKAEPLAPKGLQPFGARELLPYRSSGPKPAYDKQFPKELRTVQFARNFGTSPVSWKEAKFLGVVDEHSQRN